MARQPTTEIIEHDPLSNALGQERMMAKLQEQGALVTSERSLFGDVVTAQPIKAMRDEQRVLQRIDNMATAAGPNWFYRFPVKKKGGGTDYIEGPSIECADAVARYYGNCRVDCVVQEMGQFWIIYARFADWESGYCLIRPFLQSKAGSRLGGDDDERRLQIAMGIGVSKAQRNVIDHALKDFTTRAFDRAKQNLVERVGQKLPEYRQRCIDRISELGGGMLARVERIYNRKAADWLAPDIARIIAELRAISDGMATIDETWPLPPPPEPKRSDGSETSENNAAKPQAATAAAEGTIQAGEEAPSHTPASDEPPPKNWSLPADIVGQDNVLKALGELLEMANSVEDVDAIERQNADRVAKITGVKRANWAQAVRDKRITLAAPSGREA